MRILKSALIVVLAGFSTVLLAVAARVGLEAANIKIPYLPESVIPILCMLVVISGLRFVRGFGALGRLPFRVKAHHFIVPIAVATACQMALSIWVYADLGELTNWWDQVSLGGFLTASFMTSLEWAALDAARAGKSEKSGDIQP